MTQPSPSNWQSQTTDSLNATIAASQTVSDAIDLLGTFLVGLIIPANFDGTQVQFEGSRDGTNFVPLYNTSGSRLTVTVTAATLTGVSICPQDFAMWRYIKLVSVTTQATTSSVIGLVTRPLS